MSRNDACPLFPFSCWLVGRCDGQSCLDLRRKLIAALAWPFSEKVCQLLVYLITSVLFKPLDFGVLLLQSLSLYSPELSSTILYQAPLCSFTSGELVFLWSLTVLMILLATGPLPMLFLLPGMLFPSLCLVSFSSSFLAQLRHHLLREAIPDPDLIRSNP